VDERDPSGRGFLADLCRQWEAATARATEAGARVVHLRTGHVLSQNGGLLGRLRPVFRMLAGGKLGDGRQYMPWVHIDDHTAATRFLLEHDSISGPVNVCAPEPVTNAELTRALSRVWHRPAPWVVPKAALRLVVGELTDELLMSQRTVPKVLPDNGFAFRYTDLDKALAAVAQSA
jgi:uncharacterized protein (TIGR01777 family)